MWSTFASPEVTEVLVAPGVRQELPEAGIGAVGAVVRREHHPASCIRPPEPVEHRVRRRTDALSGDGRAVADTDRAGPVLDAPLQLLHCRVGIRTA